MDDSECVNTIRGANTYVAWNFEFGGEVDELGFFRVQRTSGLAAMHSPRGRAIRRGNPPSRHGFELANAWMGG